MKGRLEWAIEVEGTTPRVVLHGPVNEDADLAPLAAELAARQRVTLVLSGINRINSCGVREWVNFMRRLPPSLSVDLERCSPSMVSQLNMISNFVGSARVVSVEAPFVCEQCGREERVVVNVEAGVRPELARRPCGQCTGNMEFDDLEDSYFAFLNRG